MLMEWEPTAWPPRLLAADSQLRGGNAGNTDYIGWGGANGISTGANNAVSLGSGGTCTSSTVYCYTGKHWIRRWCMMSPATPLIIAKC